MRLHMFLQVLRTLESFLTEVALVGLQRNMDADMRRDVVAFDGRGSACAPLAGQAQVISRFPTDMPFADMVLERQLNVCISFSAWGLTYNCSGFEHRSPHPFHWQVKESTLELVVDGGWDWALWFCEAWFCWLAGAAVVGFSAPTTEAVILTCYWLVQMPGSTTRAYPLQPPTMMLGDRKETRLPRRHARWDR